MGVFMHIAKPSILMLGYSYVVTYVSGHWKLHTHADHCSNVLVFTEYVTWISCDFSIHEIFTLKFFLYQETFHGKDTSEPYKCDCYFKFSVS